MDDFLQRFEERRKVRAAEDRSFVVAGETLRYRQSVAPEVAFKMQAMHDETDAWADDVRALMIARSDAAAAAVEKAKDGETVEPTLGDPIPDPPYTDQGMLDVYDETALACLETDSHKKWEKLRHGAIPLVYEEIIELAQYLVGRTSQVPTVGLPGSSPEQPATGSTSRGASSSPGKGRRASRSAKP